MKVDTFTDGGQIRSSVPVASRSGGRAGFLFSFQDVTNIKKADGGRTIAEIFADNGAGCKDLACGLNVLPAYLGTDNAFHRSYLSYDTIRPQTQYRIDSSAFMNAVTLATTVL